MHLQKSYLIITVFMRKITNLATFVKIHEKITEFIEITPIYVIVLLLLKNRGLVVYHKKYSRPSNLLDGSVSKIRDPERKDGGKTEEDLW